MEACLARYKLEGTVIATTLGAKLENIAFHHPLYQADPFYDRLSPVYLADYVTTESGTGVVHSAPAYGLDDFISCKAHGMQDDAILTPVMGDGRFAAYLPLFAGMTIWEASKPICTALTEAGALFELKMFDHSYMHCWRHKTPIIYRATSQWFAGMDSTPKDGGADPARNGAGRHRADPFFPDWGKARLHGMIANRPDWTLSRQRQWGVPMAFFLHKETGQLHPDTPALIEKVAKLFEEKGIDAWQTVDPGRPGHRRQHVRQEPRHPRRLVRFGRDPPDRPARLAQGAAGLPRRPVPGRLGPAPRLVPLVAADVLDAEWRAALQGPADARLHGGRRRQEDVEVAGEHPGPAKNLRHARRRHPAPVGGLDRLLAPSCPSPTRS